MYSQVRGEVLLEFVRVGNAVKVSAIHVDTDTEVCLVGSPMAGRYELTTAVMGKLAYVLGKRKDHAMWTIAADCNEARPTTPRRASSASLPGGAAPGQRS
jgi:hypothetical protein